MYPIMDESGKVQEWLDAGRGVRVWRSREIGVDRADILTPGDVTTEPHWAYKGGSELISETDVVFFRRVSVIQDWSDTAAGWNAAKRYLSNHKLAEEREAPVGTVHTRYTIERVEFESKTRVHARSLLGLTVCRLHEGNES